MAVNIEPKVMKAVRSARNTAMDLLSRREHSRNELVQKLKQREFDIDEIEQALAQLQKENLQSDERYAESYVYQRVQKGFGPLRIEHELSQRGVSDALISQVMSGYSGGWSERMQEQRIKKFGVNIPQEYAEKMKQARFLQNRGFSPESVMRLFR
jgi:regulatory protein